LKERSVLQRISSGNVCRHSVLVCGGIEAWRSM
jgi:hypothetical protein